MAKSLDRRQFVGATAAVGAAALPLASARPKRSYRANDTVRLGVIGVGNRGTQVSRAFQEHADCEIVAVCDVFQPYLDRAMASWKPQPRRYSDFRDLLEQKDIDAVLIATPDHWHALQTVMACRAGKDVYVEKPLSVTIGEGSKMVSVARETSRVVQVGTHRRSSVVWQRAIELIKSGVLGKITMCHAYRTNNMAPAGIGKSSPSKPPATLDWDMWLGPRPARPYQANIAPYKFRWWHDYSSQFGNWGVHYFDLMRWSLDESSPISICTIGGQYAIDDDRTIPDTAQAVFEFPEGVLALFGTYEGFGNSMLKSGEFEIRGTHGTLFKDESGIHIVGEHKGQFQIDDPPGEDADLLLKASNHEDTVAHTRNFLDCVKSRQRPNADVAIGHRSTSMSLLANLSLSAGQRLDWDVESERVKPPHESVNAMLSYEYRKPWTLD